LNKIRVKTLGSVQIWVGELEITKELSKKAIAIIIYILLSKDQKVSREKLMDLFWGDRNEKAARYNLRHNLWKIRRVFRMNNLEDDWLDADYQHIRISDSYSVETDAYDLCVSLETMEDICEDLEPDKVPKILSIYGGHFMDRFYLSDCEDLNDWIYFKREEFQKMYLDILLKLGEYCEEKNWIESSICVFREIQFLMPYDDDVHFKLINNLIKIGDRYNAVRCFERFKKKLREDLNIPTSEDLRTLIGTLKNTPDVRSKCRPADNISIQVDNHVLCSVNYMVLSLVLDSIIEQFSKDQIRGIDSVFLSDLARINGRLIELIPDKVECFEHLTADTEKIRIFRAMYQLLSYLNESHDLTLDLSNLEEMDLFSKEFVENLTKVDCGIHIKY